MDRSARCSGNVQAAYQYAYGADGGRRWRKDLAGNVWTWYPCGVACCAGALVEMQSDLTGNAWSVSAQYLQGLGMVRRNGEYAHPAPAARVLPVETNGSASPPPLIRRAGRIRPSATAPPASWACSPRRSPGPISR